MKAFFLSSIFLLGVLSVNAQNDRGGGLTVKGIVTHEGTRMADATIRVYNDRNRIVEEEQSRRDGSFRVRLSLDGYYVIEFRHRGMISKRLLFKTHTPDHQKRYRPFDVEMMMFEKERAHKDPEVDMDLPLGIVEYFPGKGDFDYVEKYTIERLKEQERLLSDQDS